MENCNRCKFLSICHARCRQRAAVICEDRRTVIRQRATTRAVVETINACLADRREFSSADLISLGIPEAIAYRYIYNARCNGEILPTNRLNNGSTIYTRSANCER